MGAKIDITKFIGESVNNLKVINAYRKISGKQKRIFFTIECHCGNIKDNISANVFLKGGYSSCGCRMRERALVLSRQRLQETKAKYMGCTFCTNEGYKIEIIDYVDNHNVKIRFLTQEQHEAYTTIQNINKGEVKNPYHKSVLGVGYYGVGKHGERINGVKAPSYVTWFSMMNRCYGETYEYSQYSYIGCTVCEEWHNYQNFAQWYEENYYESAEGLELDKDIILYGNKFYSPETCLFVPKLVNTSFRQGMNEIVRLACIDKYKDTLPQHIISHMISNVEQYRKSM